jgi:general secretion pathway protein J
MTTIRKPASRRAFTLLEIMLAVTIMTMVVTVVYSTWNVAFKSWRRSSEITESLQRQRIVMGVLTDLTSSAVYFGSDTKMYGVLGKENSGEGAEVSFVTSSDAALPPGEVALLGLRRVTLKLDTDSEGRKCLSLANDPAAGLPLGESEEVWHAISYDVTGLDIRYQDARDQNWYESWREDLTLPKAIEYSITFAAADDRSQPVTIVRRVDLPSAEYAMRNKGKRPDAASGTETNQPAGGRLPGGKE